jgi:hypothetical protein
MSIPIRCEETQTDPNRYGPLTVEHNKKTMAKRAQKQRLAAEVRPDEIRHEKGQPKARDVTVQTTMDVHNILLKMDPFGRGINFFKFVINADDFGQTVENVFYTSFLIKDGKVGIHVEEDGEVIISELQRVEQVQEKYRLMGAEKTTPHVADEDGDLPRNQAIIEIDMATWEVSPSFRTLTRWSSCLA